jgi:hypothetical protein
MEDKPAKPKRTRSWSVKKAAPLGYYTAAEAIKKLGMNRATFFALVQQGKIARHIPPLRKEGFYDKKEINSLAAEMALFLHIRTIDEELDMHIATIKDAQGIYDVITSLGWPASPVWVRLSWFQTNTQLDHVVVHEGKVIAYISAVPFKPDAMEAMMSASKRGRDMRPEDIYSYEHGQTYDLFFGIAARKDTALHPSYLITFLAKFIEFLRTLKEEQDITIRYIYGASAESDGQRLGRVLGFVPQDASKTGLFPRYELNLQTSNGRWARLYRGEEEKQ